MRLRNRFGGSTLALILGAVALLSIFQEPQGSTWLAGLVMCIGASLYRSAKRTTLGLVPANPLRTIVELGGVLAIILLVGLQRNVVERLELDPVPNLFIPVWALAAFAVAKFGRGVDDPKHATVPVEPHGASATNASRASNTEPEPTNRSHTSGSGWWRGWRRLAIVLLVLVSLGTWLWLGKWANDNENVLIGPHLHPVAAGLYRPFQASLPTDWCRLAASPAFVGMSVDEQRRVAGRFFDAELADLSKQVYIDVTRFRALFIRASVEGPIDRDQHGPYRNMWAFGLPPSDHGRRILQAAVLAVPVTALILLPVFLLSTGVRWVLAGFRG